MTDIITQFYRVHAVLFPENNDQLCVCRTFVYDTGVNQFIFRVHLVRRPGQTFSKFDLIELRARELI